MTRLAALALLVLSSGCSMFGASRGERALADARAVWNASGPSAYTMTQERLCFCGPETTGPFDATVRDGAVTAATRDGETVPTDRVRTVDGLFDVLADAYRRDARRVDVTYHPTLGYPTSIWIDYVDEVADDEQGYRVTTLAPRD